VAVAPEVLVAAVLPVPRVPAAVLHLLALLHLPAAPRVVHLLVLPVPLVVRPVAVLRDRLHLHR
jgi:hypothetical protein